jgi:hypothetical protein
MFSHTMLQRLLVGCALLLAWAGVPQAAAINASVTMLPDIQLGIDASGLDTTADVYCSTQQEIQTPCVVRAPASLGMQPKTCWYAILASNCYTCLKFQDTVHPERGITSSQQHRAFSLRIITMCCIDTAGSKKQQATIRKRSSNRARPEVQQQHVIVQLKPVRKNKKS